jgi:hypothetical protein
MKPNVGGIDRTLRIAIGLVLIALMLTGTIGLWGWIGLVPFATGALRFYPFYPLLGYSSCPMTTKQRACLGPRRSRTMRPKLQTQCAPQISCAGAAPEPGQPKSISMIASQPPP